MKSNDVPSMAAEGDLPTAFRYLVCQTIGGKLVDVDPCWPGAGNAETQN